MIKDKKYLIDNKSLMNEWDWDKNNEININPEKLTLGSEKKVWWICNICKNSWFADIGHRSHGRGCPQCANVKRLQTRILNNGSLADFNPELCKEWNYEKNNGLTPHDFMPSSGKIVWWKCLSCSHEWKASICNRNSKNNKTKCPNCSLIYQSSIAEKVVFFYIKKLFVNAQENVRLSCLNNREIDIFIPEYNIGIEYDGGAWHNDIFLDEQKDKQCLDNKIELIRIREVSCPKFNNSSYIIWTEKPKNSYIKLTQPIQQLINYLANKYNVKSNVVVDIKNDYDEIIGQIKNISLSQSVANSNLIKEWDYKLNIIAPENVSLHSNKLVWWKCQKCNNTWKVSVNDRAGGNGCPYCSHKKLKSGFNDLATTNPEIVKEWDYNKNIIKPNEIFAKTNVKYWWICQKYNHSWQANPNSRIRNNSGCPYCGNHKVLEGFNDIQTTHPELMKEWNYNKNTIKPTEIIAGSNKKVWWICSVCKSEWETSPAHRTYGKKTGCPRCAEKYIGRINSIKRRKVK